MFKSELLLTPKKLIDPIKKSFFISRSVISISGLWRKSNAFVDPVELSLAVDES